MRDFWNLLTRRRVLLVEDKDVGYPKTCLLEYGRRQPDVPGDTTRGLFDKDGVCHAGGFTFEQCMCSLAWSYRPKQAHIITY